MQSLPVTVRNKFVTIHETSERLNLKDEHENFIRIHLKATAEFKMVPPESHV